MSDDSEKLDLLHGDTARLDQTFEDIKAQMKRLKLDSGNARYRNPLDLLAEAYLALLILRGSIDRSIEALAWPALRQERLVGSALRFACRR